MHKINVVGRTGKLLALTAVGVAVIVAALIVLLGISDDAWAQEHQFAKVGIESREIESSGKTINFIDAFPNEVGTTIPLSKGDTIRFENKTKVKVTLTFPEGLFDLKSETTVVLKPESESSSGNEHFDYLEVLWPAGHKTKELKYSISVDPDPNVEVTKSQPRIIVRSATD